MNFFLHIKKLNCVQNRSGKYAHLRLKNTFAYNICLQIPLKTIYKNYCKGKHIFLIFVVDNNILYT